MSYPHPPGPPPPLQPPAGTPARVWLPWVVGGVVAVFLICCGGFVAIEVFSDPAVETTPDVAAVDTPAAPTVPPTTPPTTAPPTTVKPSPTRPKTVIMPKLVGKNAAVAQDTLLKLGFPQDRIEMGTKDLFGGFVAMPENWTVTEQSEKAGARVAVDTLVVLTCTKES